MTLSYPQGQSDNTKSTGWKPSGAVPMRIGRGLKQAKLDQGTSAILDQNVARPDGILQDMQGQWCRMIQGKTSHDGDGAVPALDTQGNPALKRL